MIRKSTEMQQEIRPQMRGGKGEVKIIKAFEKDEIKSSVRMYAVLELEPGSSIGEHIHEGEDELFYILSGTGRVTDNGACHTVTAGDSVLTGDGGSHAIENIGNDTLRVLATVITY